MKQPAGLSQMRMRQYRRNMQRIFAKNPHIAKAYTDKIDELGRAQLRQARARLVIQTVFVITAAAAVGALGFLALRGALH